MYVDKGDSRSEEERALDMSGVDQLVDIVFELLRIRGLLLRILFLEDTIEAGYDVTVYLSSSANDLTVRKWRQTNMISPYTTVGAELGVSGRE